jgi:hypothetical protein
MLLRTTLLQGEQHNTQQENIFISQLKVLALQDEL